MINLEKVNFKNKTNPPNPTDPPINADNLNKIQNNIEATFNEVDILGVPSNQIQDNTDFNNITTAGIYSGSMNSTMKNIPNYSGSFKLIVMYHHDKARIKQILFTNLSNCDEYHRYYNGSWGQWQKVSMNMLIVPPNDIANGTNLNNIRTAGTYKCTSGTLAQSYINCPFIGAFKLVVEYIHNEERIRQTIYANKNSCETYTRYYDGKNWGNWYTYNLIQV